MGNQKYYKSEYLEKEIEKRAAVRRRKNKPVMKVSGASVKRLQGIIARKGKK